MADNVKRTKIPMLKSKKPLDSPNSPKPAKLHALSTNKATTIGKIQVPQLTLEEHAKRNSTLIPSQSPGMYVETNKRCGNDGAIKKSVNIAASPKPTKPRSYSEKYSRTMQQAGVENTHHKEVVESLKEKNVSFQPPLLEEQFTELQSNIDKKKRIVHFHNQEEILMSSKEKQVDVLPLLQINDEEKTSPKSKTLKNMVVELKVETERKEPESFIDLAIMDKMNENGGVLLAEDVDIGVNEIEMKRSATKENASYPVFISKQIESTDPIPFLETEGKIKSDVIEYISHSPSFDDNSEDDILDKEEFEAMEREIFRAFEIQSAQEKVTKAKKQIEKATVKRATQLKNSQEVKKPKKIMPTLDSKKSGKHANTTYVKPDTYISRQDEPVGINDVERPAELDSVISDPIIIPALRNSNVSCGAQKPKLEKNGNENEEEESQEKVAKVIYREEICTGIQNEKMEKMAEEEARKLKLINIQKNIAKGNETLNGIEGKVAWVKGVFLAMLLFSVIVGVTFIAWNIFKCHCDMKPPKMEPSVMDWMYNFIYSKDAKSANQESSKSWFGRIFN